MGQENREKIQIFGLDSKKLKSMKTTITTFIFIFGMMIFFSSNLQAQRTALIQSDGMVVDSDIDEDLKKEILEVIKNVINEYLNTATFWNELTESFDETKYTEFISLFSGSARVFDDIADDPKNIEYSVYANNIFQYMQEDGVQFDLENIYINSITRDDSGFYLADIDMEKVVYIGLNKDNFPTRFVDGKRYSLNMKIDMPDYDISDARIQSILGQEAAAKIKTASYFSADVHYGLGSYLLGTPNTVGSNFGELSQKSASVYGIQLLYRKAINQSESIWFHIGAGGQSHNLKAGFENYENSNLAPDQRSSSTFNGAFIDGAVPQPLTGIQGNLIIEGVTNGVESLNIITVDVPLGITFTPISKFTSRLFLDISVVPSYSLVSSGISTGNPEGLFLPVSEHFPSISEIQASVDGEQRLSNYRRGGSDFEFSDNDIATANNFGLGVQLSPTYQYDIDFNYGIEIGFNLWYNVLSLTSSNNSENGYLQNQYANNSFSTTTSVLEDYFNGVNPFYGSLKIGFFYKLN